MFTHTTQSVPIFLVGFSGSGKSTLAPLIAKDLGFDSIDTDSYLEAFTGQTIATLFEEKGEAYFRKLEKTLLLEQLPTKPVVVACGGGVVTIPGLCEALQQRGLVIVLQAPLATLLQRLEANTKHRPLLQGADFVSTVKKLFEARLPLYQAAGLQVKSDALEPQALAEYITQYYKSLYLVESNSSFTLIKNNLNAVQSPE